MRCYIIFSAALVTFLSLSANEGYQLSNEQLKTITKKIDALVGQKLKQENLKPNPNIDDATFLKRTFVRAAGRIPNLDEAKSFLDSKEPQKRQKLIDQILNSKGYVHDMYLFWADMFRVKASLPGFQVQPAGIPFADWIKGQMASNTPYDKFVYQMLAATGEFWKKGNEELGYYAIDRSTPLDNMSNSVQVFLGTRLQCAQCHNHPFDKWTQKQYFQMAAFTHGQSWNGQHYKIANEVRKEARAKNDNSVAFMRLERFFSTLVRFGFHQTGEGRIRLPKDYGYDDAKPKDMVYAKTIFGKEVNLEKGSKKNILGVYQNDSRIGFASWVTSKQNPRFTTVIANRMWKKVMGLGLIEPVDDFKDGTVASNPVLMQYLEKVMKDLKYDLKEFQRVLYNTRTFQRASIQRDYDDFTLCHFQGPVYQRMSGEQIWDSLSVMVNHKVDDVKMDYIPPLFELYDIYAGKTKEEIIKDMRKYEKMLADYGYDIDGKPIQDQYLIALITMDHYPEREESKRIKALFESAKDKGGYRRGIIKRGVNMNQPEVRASEITVGNGGAQLGHLIMEFGGSTRQAIQTQRRDAEMTQPLFMMNDFMESNVIRNGKTDLNKTMFKAPNLSEKINTAFLSILSRYPTSSEMSSMLKYVRETIAKAPKNSKPSHPLYDVTWALVNSHEFLFIQ